MITWLSWLEFHRWWICGLVVSAGFEDKEWIVLHLSKALWWRSIYDSLWSLWRVVSLQLSGSAGSRVGEKWFCWLCMSWLWSSAAYSGRRPCQGNTTTVSGKGYTVSNPFYHIHSSSTLEFYRITTTLLYLSDFLILDSRIDFCVFKSIIWFLLVHILEVYNVLVHF